MRPAKPPAQDLIIGPERLGFALGSSVLSLVGLALMLALVVLSLWAVGKVIGRRD